MRFVRQLYKEGLRDRADMCKTLILMLQNKSAQENSYYYFSDKATFYLRELVNKYNVRYCSEDNLHATTETVINSPKLNIWCVISKTQLIGPFFLKMMLLMEKIICQYSRISLFQKL